MLQLANESQKRNRILHGLKLPPHKTLITRKNPVEKPGSHHLNHMTHMTANSCVPDRALWDLLPEMHDLDLVRRNPTTHAEGEPLEELTGICETPR